MNGHIRQLSSLVAILVLSVMSGHAVENIDPLDDGSQ